MLFGIFHWTGDWWRQNVIFRHALPITAHKCAQNICSHGSKIRKYGKQQTPMNACISYSRFIYIDRSWTKQNTCNKLTNRRKSHFISYAMQHLRHDSKFIDINYLIIKFLLKCCSHRRKCFSPWNWLKYRWYILRGVDLCERCVAIRRQ